MRLRRTKISTPVEPVELSDISFIILSESMCAAMTMPAGLEQSLDASHNMCRVWHSFAVHFLVLLKPKAADAGQRFYPMQ